MTTRNGVMSVHFQDAYGVEGTSTVNILIDGTKTVDALVADLLTLSGVFVSLSQGLELKETLSLSFGTVGEGVPVGDIEKGTAWNFGDAASRYATGVFIPDVEPAILDANGLVDLTNVAVGDFIAYMTTPFTVVTVCSKDQRPLTTFKDVMVAFRKHRKALERRTKEA